MPRALWARGAGFTAVQARTAPARLLGVRRNGRLDHLHKLVGHIVGVLDPFIFLRGEAAQLGKEGGQVPLPLLRLAHALGIVQQPELLLIVEDRVGLDVLESHFRGVLLARPVHEETAVQGHQGFGGLVLEHMDAAHIGAQEAGDDFRMGVGILFVCLDHNRQGLAAILDFGCGSGRDTKYFLEKGYQVAAIDGSAELCR